MDEGVIIIDYINHILGLKASEEIWSDEKKLPIYLRQGRKYCILKIEGFCLLVIHIEVSKFNLSSYQKQIAQLSKYCSYQIVLCFETMTQYQRLSLINNKISFIVPGSQLYMPILGIALKEYYQSIHSNVEKLTSMAQYILLYLLYEKEQKKYSQIELATLLDISAMNVSRSIQELEVLELVAHSKQGRISYVSLISNKKETLKRAQPYLQNPILKKVYIRCEKPYLSFKIAGEEALSEISMINPPIRKIRAIDKKKFNNISKEDIVDHNWELVDNTIELEIWKYSPEMFSTNNRVDLISLALSLKNLEDERINFEINEIMEGFV